jgi:hypothetical protein
MIKKPLAVQSTLLYIGSICIMCSINYVVRATLLVATNRVAAASRSSHPRALKPACSVIRRRVHDMNPNSRMGHFNQ